MHVFSPDLCYGAVLPIAFLIGSRSKRPRLTGRKYGRIQAYNTVKAVVKPRSLPPGRDWLIVSDPLRGRSRSVWRAADSSPLLLPPKQIVKSKGQLKT